MTDGAELSRRDMMRLGATGVAAASIASLPVIADEQAAADKRLCGDTDAPVSRSAGSWRVRLAEGARSRAVNAGVNYWHKAQRWSADTFRRSSSVCRGSRIISSAS